MAVVRGPCKGGPHNQRWSSSRNLSVQYQFLRQLPNGTKRCSLPSNGQACPRLECFNNACHPLASSGNAEIMHEFSHTRLARLSTRSSRFCFFVNSRKGGGLG